MPRNKRRPRWTRETCGTCEFFRPVVGAELTAQKGECKESSVLGDRVSAWPETTETTPACGRWQEV